MEQSRPALRRSPGRVFGGVAAGLAEHLGIPVLAVRLAFVGLAFAGGFGLAAYLVFWAVVPQSDAPGRPGLHSRETTVFVATGTAIILLLIVVGAHLPWQGWAALLVAAGLALIWRQADLRGTRGRGLVLVAAGVGVLLAGLVWLVRSDRGVDSTVLALVVAAAAGWPWWRRLATELGAERRARVRSQERAEVAAHLHDSVLQTLTLIQRQADSPRQVQRLARRQERELRDWLRSRSGPATARGTLVAAVRAAADEIEDGYGILVDLVSVGDAPMGDRAGALVQAIREAMLNAAKHSGAGTVSVYLEVEPDRATVFVRDRGRGFDPAAPADGRYGLAGSVVGRMRRYGGNAAVHSAPGEGTEVELELPW